MNLPTNQRFIPLAAHFVVEKNALGAVCCSVEYFNELPADIKQRPKGKLVFRFELEPAQWHLPLDTLRRYYAEQMLKKWQAQPAKPVEAAAAKLKEQQGIR